jgi:host factor-I protein
VQHARYPDLVVRDAGSDQPVGNRHRRCPFVAPTCVCTCRAEGASRGAGKRQEKRKDKPMAAEKQQNLQDVFLNHVRKNKVPVTVFLINGVKLQGVISSFDNFCLLLRRDGHVQLVYKHAVSTVMPSAAVRLYEPSAEEQAAQQG